MSIDRTEVSLDIPILDATNYGPWTNALDNHGHLFGYAYKEWKERKEMSLRLPDIDDQTKSLSGDTLWVFDHSDTTNKSTQDGKREHRFAVTEKTQLNKDIVRDRVGYITAFLKYMSADSKSKMRSMEEYPEAQLAVSSFQMRMCIEKSHNQVSSTPIIVDRLKTLVAISQDDYSSLSSFMVEHSLGITLFRNDFESKDPIHKNHVNIDTLTSVLLLCASGDQFNNLKDNKIYDRDIHSLVYRDLSSEMVLYASAREQKTSRPSGNSMALKISAMQQQVPGNIVMSSTTSPADTSSSKITPGTIIICKQCGKDFPTFIKVGSDNETYDRCKDCAYHNKIERNKKALAQKEQDLAKAQSLIVKAGGTVNMAAAPLPPSLPATQEPVISYRDMLTYAMIKDQTDGF